jgi:superoxide dismutase, Fe-Mn family
MKPQRLPYDYDALKPFISPDMLKVHYEQHYQACIKKLNILVSKTIYENADAVTLIKITQGPIFHNAVQAWNHTFYFGGLGPGCIPIKKGPLLNAINGCFGSFGFLKAAFVKYAISLRAPGWIWLVVDADGTLEILPDNKSSHPLLGDMIPLLNCDMWEHAYTIDYQHDRTSYIEAFLKVINWEVVEKRYTAAVKQITKRDGTYISF